jgi:hypothetical protein
MACRAILHHPDRHFLRLPLSFKYKKLHLKCWEGFTWEALKPARIKAFLGLALPMGLTMAFDESIFQALVLFATRLPATDLAALGIMYQVRNAPAIPLPAIRWAWLDLGLSPLLTLPAVSQWYNIVFSLWWGIGLAMQIRVAFNLGANNPEAARCSFYVGISWALLLGCLFSGLVFLNIDRMGNLFSSYVVVATPTMRCSPMPRITLERLLLHARPMYLHPLIVILTLPFSFLLKTETQRFGSECQSWRQRWPWTLFSSSRRARLARPWMAWAR